VVKNIQQDERTSLGFKTWMETAVAAKDHVPWRTGIDGSILHEERGER